MKLPLPQRGQPFDVSLISNIITSINDLWDNLVINISNYASLWTVEGKKSVRSSEVKIVTGRSENINGKIADGDTKDFNYKFDTPFLLPPVVTATTQAIDGTKPSKGAYAVITSITVSEVKGIVRFEVKGDVSIAVNIIAIGVAV